MSLSLILTEIIAKNSSDQRKKKIQDTIQNFTYGFFLTLIGYLTAIAVYIHEYQIPIGLIYTSNGSGEFILSLIIVLCSGLLFHYINRQTIIFIEKLYDFHNKNKDPKAFKTIINYTYEIFGNHIFLPFFTIILTILTNSIILELIFLLPNKIQDSFDSNDVIILSFIVSFISFLIAIGVSYKIYKKNPRFLSENVILLFIYLLFASILAGFAIFHILRFIIEMSDPLLWMFTVTTPIVLFCVIVSNRNPQNLSTKRIRSQKKIALAILLSLTYSALIPFILTKFQIIQKRPIVLLSVLDKKTISNNNTLLVDHTDHFVAYDPVEKYSKVYQKSQYDWKPDRSVKTTGSLPGKK